MTVIEFVEVYPQYSLGASVRKNTRIRDGEILRSLPTELTAIGPYRQGRRGKPNPNNTKTHQQCRLCGHVYRNDLFSWYTNQAIPKQICPSCHAEADRVRYSGRADLLKNRRSRLWTLFAKECAICGLNIPQILEFHHRSDKKDLISQLIARVAAHPSPSNIQALISENAKCICLCPNHHRMLHYGLIALPDDKKIAPPTISQIMDAIDI